MTVIKLMIQNEKKKALQESGLICKTLQRIHTLCTCSENERTPASVQFL